MPYYVGLDASKASTHICVVDQLGAVVEEGRVETSPAAIVGFLKRRSRRYKRIGIESWSMASWIYEGLARAGLPIICINATHAHAFLKTARHKTDRNDAAGIAELMRVGAFKAVYVKTRESQEIRALLTARAGLVSRLVGLQNLIQGLLGSFGHKAPTATRRAYDEEVRAMADGSDFLEGLLHPLLAARRALRESVATLEKGLRATAQADPVCRRLMTAPGVGPIVALEFRSAIDLAQRFTSSRLVGVHLGLTPRVRQSGATSVSGRITRWGPPTTRRALYLAALSLYARRAGDNWLTAWARSVAARRGGAKAVAALARKLAVVLHRMWITKTDFQRERPSGVIAAAGAGS